MSPATDLTMLLIVGACAVIVALSGTLAIGLRRYFTRRRVEAKAAKRHLEAHFKAVEAILTDPAVSDNAKELVTMFSAALGRREIARFIAKNLQHDNVSVSSPMVEQKVSEVFDEIRQLSYRPDLQRYFSQIFMSGFLAAVMRFPETEALLPEATLMTSNVSDASSRKMTAAIVSSSHDWVTPLQAALV